MADEIVEAAFLNMVATPHPKGVYERLVRKSANHIVQYWGAYNAAINRVTKISGEEGLFSFRLFTWMEIDPDEPAINKAELEKANFPTEGRAFTRTYGVNGRIFYCVLDEKRHIITVEIKNDEGKRISPGRVETIFGKIFDPAVLGVKSELVEVTLIPQDDALSYVLGFDRLDKVEILVKRPNNDDVTSEVNRVLNRLIDMNAKSEKSTLVRAPGTDGLELDEEHLALARVAAENGRVDSSGLDSGGEKGERSTKEKPKIVKRVVERGASYFGILRNIAKEMGGRRR